MLVASNPHGPSKKVVIDWLNGNNFQTNAVSGDVTPNKNQSIDHNRIFGEKQMMEIPMKSTD